MGYCVGKGASRAQGDERRKKRMKNSEIKGVKAITRLKPYYKDNKKGQKVIKNLPKLKPKSDTNDTRKSESSQFASHLPIES